MAVTKEDTPQGDDEEDAGSGMGAAALGALTFVVVLASSALLRWLAAPLLVAVLLAEKGEPAWFDEFVQDTERGVRKVAAAVSAAEDRRKLSVGTMAFAAAIVGGCAVRWLGAPLLATPVFHPRPSILDVTMS